MTQIQPFSPILFVAAELIKRALGLPEDTDKVGGDLSYDSSQDFYIWLDLLPGGGSTNVLEGSWAVDVDVFGTDYADTMQRALDLEAALVTPKMGSLATIMRVDNVYQNQAPSERPWDDDGVYRIGATYVFTARRPARVVD